MTFTISEAPHTDPVQITTSKFTLDKLGLAVAAAPAADGVDLEVSLSAQGTYELLSSKHGWTIHRGLVASPVWEKDSLFCSEAVPTQSTEPLVQVIRSQAIAPLGLLLAQSYSDLQDYRYAPYCGLTWRGWRIEGANQEVRKGEKLPLTGADYSFHVLASATNAKKVAKEAINPAGWVFMYGDVPVGVGDACPTVGPGQIAYSTLPIC